MNPKNQLDQIEATTLLEDLKSDDIKSKINALKNLRGISFALGRERTRKELLPFLESIIEEEEDEFLLELAKVLSNFIDCIGGIQFIPHIFPLLESLLYVDEPNLRTEVINSINAILKEVNDIKEIENTLRDMINRLGQSENENQKITAIHLIALLFGIFNDKNKNFCQELITKYSIDESIIIRKELAALMPSFTINLPINLIKTLLEKFIVDSYEGVRMTIMDIIISLDKHPNQSDLIDFIISIIDKLSTDDKWRIKMTIGDKGCEVLNFKYANQKLKLCIVNIFHRFILDQEWEMRNICCIKLDEIAKKIGNEEIFERILKEIAKIPKDSAPSVRGALAGNLLTIVPIIGIRKTNEFIIPVFLELLKDENYDIRMTLIKTLEKLNKVIKIDDIIQSIIPTIIEINSNKSWRIRIQIIEVIPELAKIIEKVNFLDKIFSICIASLTDPVFAIREASCDLIRDLYVDFQGEDFNKKVLDKLKEMSLSTSYLIRNTVVIFIRKICEEKEKIKVYKDFIEKKLASFVFKLSKDKIANVRMMCAIVLVKMVSICTDKENVNNINVTIEMLKKDSDPDVVRMLK